MFTPESTLEEDQLAFAYYFLWLLFEPLINEPVEKERLSKAFGFAVMVLIAYGIDLEFRVSNGTDTFPLFDSIIDEALRDEFLRNVPGENSFVFTETANDEFKRIYPASIDRKISAIMQIASNLGIKAYHNEADFIKSCRSMVVHEHRKF